MTKNKKAAECGKVTDTIIVPSSLHFLGAFTGAYFLILGSKKWGVCIQKKVTTDRAKVPSRKGCCIRESWNSPAKDWCPMKGDEVPGNPKFFFTRKTSIPSVSNFVVLGILMNHFLRWQVQLGNQVQHAEKRNSCLKKWRATKRKQLISFNSVLKICIEPQWWFLKHRDSPQPIWIKRTNRETPTWKENWRGKSLAKPRGRKTWRSCFNHAGCKAGL